VFGRRPATGWTPAPVPRDNPDDRPPRPPLTDRLSQIAAPGLDFHPARGSRPTPYPPIALRRQTITLCPGPRSPHEEHQSPPSAGHIDLGASDGLHANGCRLQHDRKKQPNLRARDHRNGLPFDVSTPGVAKEPDDRFTPSNSRRECLAFAWQIRLAHRSRRNGSPRRTPTYPEQTVDLLIAQNLYDHINTTSGAPSLAWSWLWGVTNGCSSFPFPPRRYGLAPGHCDGAELERFKYVEAHVP